MPAGETSGIITGLTSARTEGLPMKPILVLQHMAIDGPAYLATWLRRQGLPFELWQAEHGLPCPASVQPSAGLAVLGGAMSVNDDLEHLRREEALILEAMGSGRPVVGHCLGGQLMARALGARVQASPAPEIGWNDLEVVPGEEARAWFGDQTSFRVMHWHYEAFGLPPGATLLARSAACAHQAFCIGPHLAMQFHVEADAAKIEAWSHEDSAEWATAQARHPMTVQDGEAMRAESPLRLAAQHALADRLYATWAARLPRG